MPSSRRQLSALDRQKRAVTAVRGLDRRWRASELLLENEASSGLSAQPSECISMLPEGLLEFVESVVSSRRVLRKLDRLCLEDKD